MNRCWIWQKRYQILKAYKCYVQPIVEYATQIWSPFRLDHIDAIESVQRYFTRRLCYLCHIPKLTYVNRLEYFNLESLELRRIYSDLTLLYQLNYNLIHVSFNVNSYFVNSVRSNRFIVQPSNSDIVLFSFFRRSVRFWNYLRSAVVTSTNLCMFNKAVRFCNLGKLLRGRAIV